MDIFGFIGENLTKIAITSAIGAAGSFAIAFLGRQAISVARKIAVSAATDFISGFTTNRDNQRLALEIVRWVELKLGNEVGVIKKQAAVRALKSAVPAISDKDADELIEFGVAQINVAIKQLERNIAIGGELQREEVA